MKVLELVEKVATYEYDWDGYLGEPFSEDFIMFLKDLVTNLAHEPTTASPVGSPSLLLTYALGEMKLLIDIHENYYHFVIKERLSKDFPSKVFESEAYVPNSIESINKKINEFFDTY